MRFFARSRIIADFLECWNLIEKDAKKKVSATVGITVFLNLIDLIAVGLVGAIGAIAVRGIKNENVGERTSRLLDFFRMSDMSQNQQVLFLGIAAVFLLILKSMMVYRFTRKIFIFMSYQSARLTNNFVNQLINGTVQNIQRRSTQEFIYHINNGTNHLTLGVIGSLLSAFADVCLFLFMLSLLILVDLKTATITALIFMFVGFGLHKLMQERAQDLGIRSKKVSVENNERVVELLSSFREIISRNTENVYRQKIFDGRIQNASIVADLKMMPLFSKYALEITILVVLVIIAAVQFLFNDTSRAVGNLALFLAASTRMSPAIFRIQQGMVQAKTAFGSGKETLSIINNLREKSFLNLSNFDLNEVVKEIKPLCFEPRIDFISVNFRYLDESNNWAIKNLNFYIKPYDFVAFVGPTGAGKSTIIDLLFGLLEPTDGQVLIGGISARHALKIWSGEYGYVPQNTVIHKGTVMDNLLLGMARTPESDQIAIESLKLVNLWETICKLDGGLDATLSDRGGNLSGGQRQKLGIARALMSRPKILVLDESTSALDAKSEKDLTDSLLKINKVTTLVVVAHRLSTVRAAKTLFYVESGEIIGRGDFNSLRKQIRDFDLQAEIMGLQ
jgi:ATP-binding cassette subfamily C protein